jgi:thiol-disulfide isomerase/thioredoxin
MKKLLIILFIPIALTFALSMHGVSVKASLLRFSTNTNTDAQEPEKLKEQLSLHLENVSMEEVDLIVINRWATWCGPCIQEIPDLNELVAEYEKDGVLFVAISDESNDTVEGWFSGRPDFTFDYRLISGDQELVSLLDAFDEQNGGSSIPYHLIFSPNWELLDGWVGASDRNIMEMKLAITKYISKENK